MTEQNAIHDHNSLEITYSFAETNTDYDYTYIHFFGDWQFGVNLSGQTENWHVGEYIKTLMKLVYPDMCVFMYILN